MIAGPRINHLLTAMLLVACLAGTAAGTSLGTDWKERPYTDNPFSGVQFSDDGNWVLAKGDQLLLRSWDGSSKWGGRSGTVAAMSGNAQFIATGIGEGLVMLDRDMVDNWTRNMNGQIKAVAVSKNASLVISADTAGNYNTWARNGELLGRTTDDPVKQIALSPTGNIIAATTEEGLRIYTPVFNQVWSNNKTGSIYTYVIVSGDGSTVISAGNNRLSSHTSTGAINWEETPTENSIIDIACSYDCSLIVLGSQDGKVTAVDRYGRTGWTYDAGQWVNAVAVSRYANVIVAGGVDGTVYVLDHTGKLLTSKKMDSGIRQRSIALSPDGTRIAVADEINLYGLSVIGGEIPVMTYETVATFEPAPLNPLETVETVETLTPRTTTTPVPPAPAEVETPAPQPTTQQSPAGLLTVLAGLAGTGLFITLRRNH